MKRAWLMRQKLQGRWNWQNQQNQQNQRAWVAACVWLAREGEY